MEEVTAMATTKDHLDELTEAEPYDQEVQAFLQEVEAHQAPAVDEPVVAAPRRPVGEWLSEPISRRWAAIGAGAWMALLTLGIAVEPAPANPDAVDPWYVSAVATILLLAMAGTFAGFWLRRRWGMAASLLASGILVLSTVMCPVSGHHTQVGAWWVVQLGCGLGLAAVSTQGLRRS
jgi:peptidoglycan/LPS O-acetylase OafA/YrhL